MQALLSKPIPDQYIDTEVYAGSWLVTAVIALLICNILVIKACSAFRKHFLEQHFNPHNTALRCGFATSVAYSLLASVSSTYWTLIIGHLDSFCSASKYCILSFSDFRSVWELL